MSGELFINNQDAWSTWSVALSDNAYESLLLPAPPKELTQNKSRIQDGKNVSMPTVRRIDERELQVMFAVHGDTRAEYLENYAAFVTELNSGFVEFKVVSIDIVFKFTTTSYASLALGTGIKDSKLLVKFNEPNPTDRTPATIIP